MKTHRAISQSHNSKGIELLVLKMPRAGERIYIGSDGGYIVLIEQGAGRTRIGFEFPKDVVILRGKFVADKMIVVGPISDDEECKSRVE